MQFINRLSGRHFAGIALGGIIANWFLGYLDKWFWHPVIDLNNPGIAQWMMERIFLPRSCMFGFLALACLAAGKEKRSWVIRMLAIPLFALHLTGIFFRPFAEFESHMTAGQTASLSVYYLQILIVWVIAAYLLAGLTREFSSLARKQRT